MRNQYEKGSTVDLIMKVFCGIVMPGHKRKPGYINVKKISDDLGVDRRTYYNWLNSQAAPSLAKFIRLLEDRGYTIQIVKKDKQY